MPLLQINYIYATKLEFYLQLDNILTRKEAGHEISKYLAKAKTLFAAYNSPNALFSCLIFT